ncbi:MAG: CCA tRNA nucleotidyltransferase [Proteobacteria bacterium]|nr:CCA tRNA nucleotidyltransferase [Pseudomonadota bacterium]
MQLTENFTPEIKTIFAIFGDNIRLVGGCVRDLLLEKKINDFDFATKFLPNETTKILEKNKIKAVPTGAKFGTITAVINDRNFEITTLRKDNETDGRHCEPEFVDDFLLDASRRDFTVNALYMDSRGQISDYFDGISDLKKQKLRFIGDAEKRIEEDFLRILRFFRFSVEYANELDAEGLKACVNQKENLKKISRERIRQEFLKLISSKKKERVVAILKTLEQQKISDEIFSSSLDIPAFERLQSDDSKLKIAALLLNKNFKPEEICATNSEKKLFNFLLSIDPNQDLRLLRAFHDEEFFWNFCLFNAAKQKLPAPRKLEKLPNFPIEAKDLIELGLKGRQLGEALDKLKKLWAESDFKLDKKSLLKFLT